MQQIQCTAPECPEVNFKIRVSATRTTLMEQGWYEDELNAFFCWNHPDLYSGAWIGLSGLNFVRN